MSCLFFYRLVLLSKYSEENYIALTIVVDFAALLLPIAATGAVRFVSTLMTSLADYGTQAQQQ